jgi:flagellar biosynthesis GTPase FlhF
MPITISFEARDAEDLRKSVEFLNSMLNSAERPEKTLADFSLQDIHEYWKANQTTAAPADEQPEAPAPEKKTGKKAKEAAPVDVAPAEEKAPEPAPAASETSQKAEDIKQAAIKKIMAVYATPLGKKLAGELLKEFAVRNFNLIPDDRAAELLSKVETGIKAAGL